MPAVLARSEDWNSTRKFGGLIGISAFKDIMLELDFRDEKVVAIRRGAEFFPGVRSVPYDSDRSEIPRVQLIVANRRLHAVLDTGSEFTLLVPDLDGYPLCSPPITDVDGAGYGASLSARGERPPRRAQLEGAAKLGPIVWRNPPLRSSVSGDVARIGVGVLRNRILVIDARAHRLYFLEPELNDSWARGIAAPPPSTVD